MTNRDEWETPQHIFEAINRIMFFTVDAAANATNTRHLVYWDIKDDGLKQDWGKEVVWCNPPYLNQTHVKWVDKAIWSKGTSCLLIPATPGTKLWQDKIFPYTDAILWFNGRIKFLQDGKEVGSPRFDSAAVFFNLDDYLKESLLMGIPDDFGYIHVNY